MQTHKLKLLSVSFLELHYLYFIQINNETNTLPIWMTINFEAATLFMHGNEKL